MFGHDGGASAGNNEACIGRAPRWPVPWWKRGAWPGERYRA